MVRRSTSVANVTNAEALQLRRCNSLSINCRRLLVTRDQSKEARLQSNSKPNLSESRRHEEHRQICWPFVAAIFSSTLYRRTRGSRRRSVSREDEVGREVSKKIVENDAAIRGLFENQLVGDVYEIPFREQGRKRRTKCPVPGILVT